MTAPIAAVPSGARRFRTRLTASAVILAVAALAGFLLVGQLRGRSTAGPQTLAAENEADLARILANLNSEADALQNEIAQLKVQLTELRQSSSSDAEAAAELDQQIRSLEVLAGTVPVTGPGVVVTATDPDAALTYDSMIDIVQELRDAGAEAIAINDHRVGVATSFATQGDAITIDGTRLTAPYRVAAIGQPATLEGGLKIPGGAVDAMTAVKDVRVDVQKLAKVDIPALAAPPTFRTARPVGSKP
ncbi:MAG TPA: DUF881 domain-containing protein [Acidimicrobiales bacterium]|nr:DUF881 domain-containing protein [Acidimicrobiales bacterium]